MPRRRGASNAFATDVPAERIRLIATALVLLMREFDRVRALGVCVCVCVCVGHVRTCPAGPGS
jgi:hypothetical protein